VLVIDGSALFAIMLDEPNALRCSAALENMGTRLLSAGSLTELLIVAAGKGVLDLTTGFIDSLAPTIVPVTEQRARAAADAFRKWGRGFHRAKLNFGDCFAYALAKEYDCPLLFVGRAFSETDVKRAFAPNQPMSPLK